MQGVTASAHPLERDEKPRNMTRFDVLRRKTSGFCALGLIRPNSRYVDKGAPWQNGKSDSRHGKLRDECLERELFHSRLEARVVIQNYRLAFNRHRPHSSLGYQTPDEVDKRWNQNQKSLT